MPLCNRPDERFGLSPTMHIVPALRVPVEHGFPIGFKQRVSPGVGAQFFFQSRLHHQLLRRMGKEALHDQSVREIVPLRPLRDTRLQRALDRIARQIISPVIQAQLQQGARFPQPDSRERLQIRPVQESIRSQFSHRRRASSRAPGPDIPAAEWRIFAKFRSIL